MRLLRPCIAAAVLLLGNLCAFAQVQAEKPALALRLEPVETLGEARLRHAGDITHVEPLADGKRALATSRDGSVRLWDLTSGEELRRYLQAKREDVWNVKLLPGEREFLSCGEDNHVTRWNLETGEALARYKLPSTVLRLAVVPGGKQFIACDSGRSATLWDIDEGVRKLVFKGHTDAVYSATVSPDGKICVTCGEDGTVRAWDVASGDKLWVINKLDAEGAAGGADPFGGEEPPHPPAGGDPFGAFKAEPRVETPAAEALPPGHAEDVFTVCFLPDGKRVVSCSADTSLCMWNAVDGQQVWTTSVSGSAKVVACNPDGTQLAVTSDDSTIHLLSAADGKSLRVIKLPGGAHWPVTFSVDGKRLLSGGDQTIFQFDAASGKQLFPPDSDQVRGAINHIAILPGGKRLLATASGQVHIWDLPTRKRIATWELPTGAEALDVSADGSRLLMGIDEQLVVCDSVSGKEVKRVNCGNLRSAVFAAGGKVAITSNWDGRTAFDLESGQTLWSQRNRDDDATISSGTVTVSSDGQRFVAVGENTLNVHRVADGGVLKRVRFRDGVSIDSALSLEGDAALVLLGEVGEEPKLFPLVAKVAHDADGLPAEEMNRLVERLGHDDFAVREQAMQTLIAGGRSVVAQLPSDDQDNEVRWRLKRIRDLVREGLLPVTMLEQVDLDLNVRDTAAHPTLPVWAMVAGYDCRATLQLGGLVGTQVTLGKAACDGHSPNCVTFGPYRKTVFTGNRDGTVSVFRLVE